MAEGSSSSSRKRPLPFDDDDDNNDTSGKHPPQRRVRFPKGKKVKPGAEVVASSSQAEDEDPELAKAKLASKVRALRRNHIPVIDEGTEMLHDISVAEVDYEDNETFVDDGIQMEPFNLRKEREEGYFDQSGNFVEYINQDHKDAWLDNVEVDPKLAGKCVVETTNEDENAELTAQEIGMMKRRMADVLEPGETVLRALRRLKGTSSDKKEKMSAETKLIFDQLTEDAMRLMENGDYNVYEETQEVFQREAEGYEKLAQAKEGVFTNLGQNDDAFDMFADDDENGHANPASGGSELVAGDNNNIVSQPSESGSLQNDYVYDETSGYYYSSSFGYYYDPSSGLYCSAATGQWYSYDQEKMTYDEVQVQETESTVS